MNQNQNQHFEKWQRMKSGHYEREMTQLIGSDFDPQNKDRECWKTVRKKKANGRVEGGMWTPRTVQDSGWWHMGRRIVRLRGTNSSAVSWVSRTTLLWSTEMVWGKRSLENVTEKGSWPNGIPLLDTNLWCLNSLREILSASEYTD